MRRGPLIARAATSEVAARHAAACGRATLAPGADTSPITLPSILFGSAFTVRTMKTARSVDTHSAASTRSKSGLDRPRAAAAAAAPGVPSTCRRSACTTTTAPLGASCQAEAYSS